MSFINKSKAIFNKITVKDLTVTGTFTCDGDVLAGVVSGTVSVNPPSLTTGAAGTVAVTITGVVATDIVVLEPAAALEAGLEYRGHNVTANTVTIQLVNRTAGTIDGAAANWKYKIIKAA